MFGGPRLYRYYNYENAQYIEAPTGGWAPDINPWELAPNQAQQLDNFLTREGKIMVRGGMDVRLACNDTGHTTAPVGFVIGDTHTSAWGLLVNKFPSNTAVVENWNAPLLKPTASTSLSKGNASHTVSPTPRWCSLSSNPSASVPGADLTAVPGPRYINFNGYIYGITYDAQGNANGTATDTNNNYTLWKTCLYTLPLTQTGFTQPTLLTNAPQGAFDIKGYQNRIWLLAGIDVPGGLTHHEPCTLFFTNPIAPTDAGGAGGSAAADWKDPVSGFVNKITMDNNNDDYAVGLATVRNGLIVFRRSSVWLLRGTTTANYTFQLLSNEVGCVDARSIVEVDGGVYWLSLQGLTFSNGVAVTPIESPASKQVRAYVQQAFGSLGVAQALHASATMALLSEGSILVTIQIQQCGSVGDWSSNPYWSAIYTPDKGGGRWMQLTSYAFVNGNSAFAPVQIAGFCATRRAFFQTYIIDDAGISVVEDMTVQGLSIMYPEVSVARGHSLYDVTVQNTAMSYIPAVWGSKFVDVVTASRRRAGAIKRFFADYAMTLSNNNGDTNAFTVSLMDSAFTNRQTLTCTALCNQITQFPNNGGRIVFSPALVRANQDSALEVDDVWFKVSWIGHVNIGIGGSISFNELYGIGVEWQQTRDLRTRT